MIDKAELATAIFGERTLAEWEGRWTEVPNALQSAQPKLRYDVGLIRAKLNGRVIYILRATENGKGGIAKALQRIRGQPQTGNAGFGAQMLRKHAEDLKIEVLIIGEDQQSAELAKGLKIAMIKYHDPEWNKPHTRRMRELREGLLQ